MEIIKTVVAPKVATLKEQSTIKRVAAYCRVSTDSDEQGESYESQISYYESLIKNNPNYQLSGVYGDKGISGLSAEDRPEFMRLIKDCEDGKIDLIYVKSISRFSRNAAECSKYVDLLTSKGVTVIFEKENIRSDDKSLSVVLKILATLAQQESNSISQAQRWAYTQNAKMGRPTRVVAYGYRKVTKGRNKHVWEINDEKAWRVRKAFALALSDIPIVKIVEELNKIEEEENTGVKWTQSRVSNLLRNEVYTGTIITNKTVVVDYVSKKSVKNNGIVEQVKIENHHEAIVSPFVFKKINEKFKRRKCKHDYQ